MKKILLVTRISKFILLLLSFSFFVFAPAFTWQINDHQKFVCNGFITIFGGNFGTGNNALAPVSLIAFIFFVIAILWNVSFNFLLLTKKEIPLKTFKRISYVVSILQIVTGVLIFYSIFNFVIVNGYGDTVPEYFKDTYFVTLAGSFSLMSGLLNAFEILAI